MLDLECRGSLLHHRRELVEVADHHPPLGQRHECQRLVGANLVGLVEDQPVEDLEAKPRVDREPVAGAGDQVVGLEVVALYKCRPDSPRHLAWLGDAGLTHMRKAEQSFLAGVDRVVGVG